MKAVDRGWAAGFLEADGSFGADRTSLRVTATQIDREPIDRLQELFGGSVCRNRKPTSAGNPIYVWTVAGCDAFECMSTLRPLLSRRKQTRVDEAMERHGYVHRHGHARGTIVTPKARAAIFRRAATGEALGRIAKTYGVTPQYIGQIIHGKRRAAI